jgi:hypothetical protein
MPRYGGKLVLVALTPALALVTEIPVVALEVATDPPA